MKPETEQDIRRCLGVVLGREPGDLEEAIRTLDNLKTSTGGHLFHYLSKRSYEKAWILLEGGDPEKGICAR